MGLASRQYLAICHRFRRERKHSGPGAGKGITEFLVVGNYDLTESAFDLRLREAVVANEEVDVLPSLLVVGAHHFGEQQVERCRRKTISAGKMCVR